jgi:hypothetical protein
MHQMAIYGWLQLVLFVALLFGLAKPVGLYILRVLDAEGKTFLDPLLRPLERLLYRFLGIEPQQEQTWQQYAFSLLVFSLVGCLFTYGVLRLQGILPLNPQHFGPVSPDLAFNTAASFTTNTNWQNYGGNPPSPFFLKWWDWSSTTSFRPQPGSEWPQPSCGGSVGTKRRLSAISGRTWCARTFTCCCLSRCFSLFFWYRRA